MFDGPQSKVVRMDATRLKPQVCILEIDKWMMTGVRAVPAPQLHRIQCRSIGKDEMTSYDVGSSC